MSNVWLIRHGESTINAGTWSNQPHAALLTAKGQQQAEQAAAQIHTRPDLIVVSPAQRAQDSAIPIIQRWHDLPVEIWPIQEFTYLMPAKCQNLTLEQRQVMITNYWQRCDPFFCDGEGAESFATFLARIEVFHAQLGRQHGFIVVVGHGQFFRAYQLGLSQGFAATSAWMQQFREKETATPLANGEIIKLNFH